ncbi:YetF domain-containing protein [Azotobacter chroococcum]|nr:YetF domain-containing protein [Azotobacter chroococcum]
MDAVLRATAIYLALLALFKIAGRRTLADISNFDLLLLLIIGEATQQALLGDDFSLTNALIVIVTLIVIDVGLSFVKLRFARIDMLIEGTSTLIVEDGRPLKKRLHEARLREEDILLAARQSQGLERMNQIKYAILEKNGKISIIPYSSG